MRDDVARDMRHSIHAVSATWQQWSRTLTGAVELHPAEGDSHPVLRMLDRMGFTDYFGRTAHGIVKIAMRAQFPPHRYATHTVRTDRWNGVPTEWPKLREALANGDEAELPTWTVQIYVSKDGLTFIGGGAVRTQPFVEWLVQHEGELDRRTSPEEFMIAPWAWMRRDGLEVRAVNEDALKPFVTRYRGPFEYFNKPIVYGPCPRCGMATAIGFKGDRILPDPTLCTACRADDMLGAAPWVGEWNRAAYERASANGYQHELARQWAAKARPHTSADQGDGTT